MVLLVHETNLDGLKGILKDGALKPSCKHKGTRYGDDYAEDCMDEVYLSVFHPFQTINTQHAWFPVLFFSSDVLKIPNKKHWNPEWLYGEFDKEKGSLKYYKSKTPEQNIALWGEQYKKFKPLKKDLIFKPGFRTDEVVIDGDVPIQDYLVGIYTADTERLKTNGITIPPELHIKTRPALTKFLKQHGYA